MEIFSCCQNGNLEAIREFLKTNSVDFCDENQATILHYAVANNQVEVVKLLLQSKADIYKTNSMGWNVLHQAAINGHNSMINLLLKHDKNGKLLYQRNHLGSTVIEIAIASGHISTLELLLTHWKSSNCAKKSLITTAIVFANEAILKYLLEKQNFQEWVNIPAPEIGWTPIMFAANLGNQKLVRILLEHEADPNIQNTLGQTAIQVAQENVKPLLKPISNSLESLSDKGQIFLEACRQNDTLEITNILEDPNFNVETEDTENGANGLILASINGNTDLIKILIGLGTNLDKVDKIHGWTALMQATFYGHKEVVHILLRAGADPTIASKDGSTALDIALLVDETDKEMIQMLARETVNVAPPLMSFLPNTRPPTSKLARSVSTPALTTMAPKPNKIAKWWDKITAKFSKNEDEITSFSRSMDVQVTEIKTEELMDNNTNLIHTSGFTAALKDFARYDPVLDIQPVEERPMMVLEIDSSISRNPLGYVIDTKKLLSNYYRTKPVYCVKDALARIGLENLHRTFQDHEIDFEAFKLLKEKDLQEMKINDKEAKRRLISYLNKTK